MEHQEPATLRPKTPVVRTIKQGRGQRTNNPSEASQAVLSLKVERYKDDDCTYNVRAGSTFSWPTAALSPRINKVNYLINMQVRPSKNDGNYVW